MVVVLIRRRLSLPSAHSMSVSRSPPRSSPSPISVPTGPRASSLRRSPVRTSLNSTNRKSGCCSMPVLRSRRGQKVAAAREILPSDDSIPPAENLVDDRGGLVAVIPRDQVEAVDVEARERVAFLFAQEVIQD